MFLSENRNGLIWVTNLGHLVLKVDNQITYHKCIHMLLHMGDIHGCCHGDIRLNDNYHDKCHE